MFLAGTIGSDVFHGIVFAAAVSMVTSSYTSRHADEIYEYVEEKGWIDPVGETIDHDVDSAISGHCIIAGFDVQGKRIAEFLEEEGIPFVVMDNDPDKIIEARSRGYQYVFGSVMGDEVWPEARLDEAALVISTIPFPSVSRRILELNTGADVILRSEDREEAASLIEECLYVINSDVLGAERMAAHVRNSLASEEYREN
jgi:CPA2 family monovalent cation:H+ antiporter-2